ncbi:hypothetical protein [Saccharopolyspora cebuensis]|uniref:Uncharacterized protein n=1 Tax=Saccharopolyspora cebuensis TaxID=418759 RepID=A0ABV4C9H4_9PSEU
MPTGRVELPERDGSAAVEHRDALRRARPVRDDEGGAGAGHPLGGGQHRRLAQMVRRGRRLVEQHARIDELGPRRCDELPLPRGQPSPRSPTS